MESPEFSEKLSNFPEIKKYFEGIFSADNLPKKIKKIVLLFVILMFLLVAASIGIVL